MLSSCKKGEEPSIPPGPTGPDVDDEVIISPNAFFDLGNINIRTLANGNSWDIYDLSKIKDISGSQYGYCHPDVQYFENGLNGFKYWMAFTPYFGSIGASGESVLYENPTIVASNDGIHWEEPKNIVNPTQKRPSFKDGIVRSNNDTLQGYWSDTDLVFVDNHFELYFRGSNVSPTSLNRICAKSSNNETKTIRPATRTIVKQVSTNGVNWKPLEILYTSNEPETLNNNDVLSPSFIPLDNQVISYEVLFNKGTEGYKEDDNSFVLKRTSKNGLDFSPFSKSKIVHFENKPWRTNNKEFSPWHIDARYVDGYYFLYLAVGRVRSYTSDDLYIAYSKDGDNFKVFPTPLVPGNVYRSCIFPLQTDKSSIEFGSVIGMKSGQFKYRKFKVNKQQLNKVLG